MSVLQCCTTQTTPRKGHADHTSHYRDHADHTTQGPCRSHLTGTVQTTPRRDHADHTTQGPCRSHLTGTVQTTPCRDHADHTTQGPCRSHLTRTMQVTPHRDHADHTTQGPCMKHIDTHLWCAIDGTLPPSPSHTSTSSPPVLYLHLPSSNPAPVPPPHLWCAVDGITPLPARPPPHLHLPPCPRRPLTHTSGAPLMASPAPAPSDMTSILG